MRRLPIAQRESRRGSTFTELQRTAGCVPAHLRTGIQRHHRRRCLRPPRRPLGLLPPQPRLNRETIAL